MIAKKPLILIAVGACVLGLSGLGSEKNPVPRPYKSRCEFTTVVNLDSGLYETFALGNTAHLGYTALYAAGEMNPLTLTPISQEGNATAANGDQLFWELGPEGALPITGGTGRFVGATGSLIWAGFEDLDIIIDGLTMTLTYSATVEGTIVY